MKLVPVKLKWHPASQKPDKPGVYMIWSPRLGARMCTEHPTWWNHRSKLGKDHHGPKVVKWAYLWPQGHWRNADNGLPQP